MATACRENSQASHCNRIEYSVFSQSSTQGKAGSRRGGHIHICIPNPIPSVRVEQQPSKEHGSQQKRHFSGGGRERSDGAAGMKDCGPESSATAARLTNSRPGDVRQRPDFRWRLGQKHEQKRSLPFPFFPLLLVSLYDPNTKKKLPFI